MKLLVTGSSGLVGSRFVNLYKDKFSITSCGRENADIYLNLLSHDDLKKVVEESDAEVIINFAAYTNVDQAENEKGQKDKEVYILNVMVPLWLAESCQKSGKKLYHISTDYVFDGKKEDKPYTEDNLPNPVNSWYSITKFQGEISVKEKFKNSTDYAIIRISYPYSGVYKRKMDVARTVVSRLSNNQSYQGIINQKVKPTSVDDIADALNLLLTKNASGIFHVAGNFSPIDYITPYDFAYKIAETFNLDSSLIESIDFNEFSRVRIAPRPQHTWLDTRKIENLGLSITSWEESLSRFKQQLTSHQEN